MMFASAFLGDGSRPSHGIESSDSLDTNDNDHQSEMSWIEWYCSLKGHQYYVMIDESYIRDDFNLVGLSCQVSYYTQALQIILDNYDDDEDEDDDDDDDEVDLDQQQTPPSSSDMHADAILGAKAKQQIINSSAQLLYGLIHSRFIITNKGMQLMMQKYREKVFGTCPNFSCENAAVLPIGIVDTPTCSTAKIFCPRCNEIYHPPKSSRLALLDGAYFGTTFAHLFLMINAATVQRGPTYYYVPKIYGFKVYPAVRNEIVNVDKVNTDNTDSTVKRDQKQPRPWVAIKPLPKTCQTRQSSQS